MWFLVCVQEAASSILYWKISKLAYVHALGLFPASVGALDLNFPSQCCGVEKLVYKDWMVMMADDGARAGPKKQGTAWTIPQGALPVRRGKMGYLRIDYIGRTLLTTTTCKGSVFHHD